MRIVIILNFILSFVLNTGYSQSNGVLFLDKDELSGDCENRFFSGFKIELDSIYTELDSASLFNQFPRVGTINFKNRIEIPTEFTLTQRAGFPQIMFRFKSTYLTFDNLSIKGSSISFTIDNDPDVPVTEDDLKIIRIAKSLLSDETYWNKHDDRICDDDISEKSYSLYCALRIASLEVEEKYNHRNAVLQKLRHLIEQNYPNKQWSHRLMDFNNMEETNYQDVVYILDQIESDFIKELKN